MTSPVDSLLADVEKLDPLAQEHVRATVAAILAFHGDALARALALVGKSGVDALAADPQTSALLILHGLHPQSPEDRARAALVQLGPRLESHAAGAHVESFDGTTLRVALTCPATSPRAVVRDLVLGAVGEAASDADVEIVFHDASLVPATRLVRREPAAAAATTAAATTTTAATTCDLCGTALADEHEHLFDPQNRDVACACGACAVLFPGDTTKKKRVRPRHERIAATIPTAAWDLLGVPVDLAFFWRSSAHGRVVAAYPGPAGAIESALSFDVWSAIAEEQGIPDIAEDVEAILVNRTRGRDEVWRLSIDRCFALVGAVRQKWRGVSGGEAVLEEIDRRLASEASAHG